VLLINTPEALDADVGAELLQILGSDGIYVIAHAEIVGLNGRSGNGIKLLVRTSYGEKTIARSDILIAMDAHPTPREWDWK
jgi:hypothetical protein